MNEHSHADCDMAVSIAVDQLARPYLEFTRSLVRSEERRLLDLRELIGHPHIKRIAFYHGSTEQSVATPAVNWMIIGTTHVQIVHDRVCFNIGEFLLWIARQDADGGKSLKVLAENVTPRQNIWGGPRQKSLRYDRDGSEVWYAHPHVGGGGTSAFCMNGDTHTLNEALSEGNMPEVFSILDAALHSYGPGNPYCQLRNWPTALM